MLELVWALESALVTVSAVYLCFARCRYREPAECQTIRVGTTDSLEAAFVS